MQELNQNSEVFKRLNDHWSRMSVKHWTGAGTCSLSPPVPRYDAMLKESQKQIFMYNFLGWKTVPLLSIIWCNYM